MPGSTTLTRTIFAALAPLAGALAAVAFAGCSRGPERIDVPSFEPNALARDILEKLDRNLDGILDATELRLSPGLNASVGVFDSDGDKKLSADELAGQFEKWLQERTGLISLRCEVHLRGRPLPNATVRFVPEPFFEGVVPQASGITDAMGMTELSCDAEQLPPALKSMRAIKPGVYRVEVTHPQASLPAKYNTGTILGRTVSLRNSQPMSLNL
jgi:hypothetical protein